MRELNKNERTQVNGGIIPLLVVYAVYKALEAVYEKGQSDGYNDNRDTVPSGG